MNIHGAVILFLIMLPAAVIGYIAGMVHMRRNYLAMLRSERAEKRKILRRADQAARAAREMGREEGYWEGRAEYL